MPPLISCHVLSALWLTEKLKQKSSSTHRCVFQQGPSKSDREQRIVNTNLTAMIGRGLTVCLFMSTYENVNNVNIKLSLSMQEAGLNPPSSRAKMWTRLLSPVTFLPLHPLPVQRQVHTLSLFLKTEFSDLSGLMSSRSYTQLVEPWFSVTLQSFVLLWFLLTNPLKIPGIQDVRHAVWFCVCQGLHRRHH